MPGPLAQILGFRAPISGAAVRETPLCRLFARPHLHQKRAFMSAR
jgi:hypothetical protein